MDKKNWKERLVKKRKRAAEALRASETRHQTILEWALDAIISVDREGRIIEFNRAAETMFGHASKDVLGKEMSALIIPPALRERYRAGWERHLTTGATSIICKRIEITAMRAGGAEFPIELFVTRFGPEGNPTFTSFIRDITERKRAEDALHASEAELRALFTAMTDVVLVLDSQGRYMQIAPTNPGLLYKPPTELLGKTIHEVLPKENADLVLDCIHRALKTGRPFNVEYSLQIRDTEVWFDGRVSPLSRDTVFWVARDITARKQVEKALLIRVRVLESMLEGVSLSDESGVILYTNPAEDAMFGYEPGELIGKHVTVLNTYPPEENTRIVEGVIEQLKTRGRWEGEFSNRRKDGTAFSTHARITALELSGKRYWVYVQADITERKRAENSLKLFRALLDEANDAIEIIDPATACFLDCNVKACSSLGYAREEFLSLTVPDIGPAVTLQTFAQYMTQLREVREGGALTLETVHRRKDGSTFPVEVNCRLVRLDREYVLAIVRDITERKRAEEVLRESETRLAHALDATTEGVWDWNIRTGEVLYSPRWIASLGYSSEEVPPHVSCWERLVHPEDLPRVWKALDDHWEGRTPLYECENRLRLKTGEWRYNLDQGRVVEWDAEGKPLRMVGTDTDITERKRKEDERARLFKELQDSHKQLQRLSHRLLEVQETERRHVARELHDEIGQCLTGLKLGLETALRLPERESRRVLLRLVEQTDSLISMSRELSLDLRPAMLDDMGLLPALLFHFERFTERFGVRVRFEHGGIERRFHPCLETAVFRIVQEALTNVARHSRAEEAMVTITTEEDGLTVQVKDEGVGFDPDKAIASGKAVGLSGIHERAILLGGHCDIESAPGASTQVTVRFSLSKVAEREASGRAQRAEHG